MTQKDLPDDLGQQMGILLAQSQSNNQRIEQSHSELSGAIRELNSEFSGAIRELRIAIERISRASAPNMANMAAWAVVVLMIVGMVGTPIAYHFNQQHETFTALYREQHEALDSKLQREFALALEAAKVEAAAMDKSTRDRDGFTIDRLIKLEDFQRFQIQEDLKELRERRMKDSKP